MKILSFGEILLRLSSPGYTRLFQRDFLETSFCGGEANVAASLAILGEESYFVTKVPNNELGNAALNSLKYFGVDTSKTVFGKGRLGTYYLEKGASQRPSKVIYDREYSSIALAESGDFDFDLIFKDVDWFHFTGINPALSDNIAHIILEACKKAKERGIIVSCDLNYRSKLWSSDCAINYMQKVMPFVDVCIANEEDAEKMLGIKAENSSYDNGELDTQGYVLVAKEICKRYDCKYVAITLRESISASRNKWSAIIYGENEKVFAQSKKYDIEIVDRVGGGDSFTAGIIYSIAHKKNLQEIIDFATASSCLKHTFEGDYNRTTLSEIEELLKSNGNGRVQR